MSKLNDYSLILKAIITENIDTTIGTKKAIIRTWFLCVSEDLSIDDFCTIIKQNKGIDSTFDYILNSYI